VTGTTSQIDDPTIARLSELVRGEARAVSQLLGFRARAPHP